MFRSVLSAWGVVATASLALAAAACSTASNDLTSHDVEAIIQESEEQDRTRTAALDDLVISCMTQNGFDYTGPTRESGGVDLAPGLSGVERIQAIGSETVAGSLWMMDQDPQELTPQDSATSDTSHDEAFWDTLQEAVTMGGETIPGGCVRWAEGEYLRLHPEYSIRMSLNVAYGEHMSAAYQDVRLVALFDEWAACMAADGYSGYHEPGDHMDDLERRVAEIRASSSNEDEIRQRLEQLKLFDIEVTLSAYSCWEQIENRRDEILAEYARSFAEAHNDELAELQNSR